MYRGKYANWKFFVETGSTQFGSLLSQKTHPLYVIETGRDRKLFMR